jgi:hypothetical protein
MVRGAFDGDLLLDGMVDPAAEIGARGQQEGGVEEAGATRIVRVAGTFCRCSSTSSGRSPAPSVMVAPSRDSSRRPTTF